MKRIAIAIVIILGVVALFATKGETVEYVAPVEVEVDALEKAIKDAQDAKRDEITKVAQKAYDDTLDHELKKIELEVIASFNKELDARQKELEKETGAY